jgi:CubicO group peptidase (beta-lactamase class C family)
MFQLFKRLLWIFLIVILVTSCFSCKQNVNNNKDFIDALTKKAKKWDKSFSGAILVADNSGVLFEYYAGEASKNFHVKNMQDTRFNLASINKMFTSVAIMQLVEKGQILLNDTISKYIDSTWLSAPLLSQITVEQLLNHTSGLGNFFNEVFWKSSRLNYRKLTDYEFVVYTDTLLFNPGSGFNYSNTGMFLAGLIIEKVTGTDYFRYIDEHIYSPAGMTNSGSLEMDRVNENIAVGYHLDEKGLFIDNSFYHVLKGSAAGGGYSTANDLYKFAKALLSGKLVSDKTLTQMVTDKAGYNYGYGISLGEENGVNYFGHGGTFMGISNNVTIFSKSKYIVIILSNYTDGSIVPLKYIRNYICTNNINKS